MDENFNPRPFLWAIGMAQPTTLDYAHAFLKKVTQSESDLLTIEEINNFSKFALDAGLIEVVSKKNKLYSLTNEGGVFIGKGLRLLRDKNRLLLLKSFRRAKLTQESSPTGNLAGAAPVVRNSSALKAAPRPEVSLASGPLPQNQRNFWPRVSEQFNIGLIVGELSPSINLNFYSRNIFLEVSDSISAIDALSLCIGVSPRLIGSMCHAQSNHYRTFTLMKKSGGTRTINSPRAFLKTVQYWIKDYLIYKLPVHDACFSYRKGLSVKNNACVHLNKKYILCVDIDNYFGSIKTEFIHAMLHKFDFSMELSEVLSQLMTLDGSLPQGAPTSPDISNSFLYDFDVTVSDWCSAHNVSYSRYSDDLTFGLDSIDVIGDLKDFVINSLLRLGLRLKEEKTRVMSCNNRQMITGVVINNGTPRPSRKFRKMVRAAFFNAQDLGDVSSIKKLRGYLNYLSSFEGGDTSENIAKYSKIISSLEEIKIKMTN